MHETYARLQRHTLGIRQASYAAHQACIRQVCVCVHVLGIRHASDTLYAQPSPPWPEHAPLLPCCLLGGRGDLVQCMYATRMSVGTRHTHTLTWHVMLGKCTVL